MNLKYKHIYTMLEEIFESSIEEVDKSELISNLGELYDSFNGQGFEESFEEILLFIVTETRRSRDVSKLFHFIAESTITLDNKYKTAAEKDVAQEEIDDIVHPLLKYLFKILNGWSEGSSSTVRLRSCQLLYTILTYVQDHGLGEIDMETFENIGKVIEDRRLDACGNVRAHAALLSKFFQDPSTVNDPVIAALCWQMQHDPNACVRQNIVSIIAACEETIVPIACRFLYDKHPGVRNAALIHICERIGPRSFAPAQRILILNKCFTDPSDVIRHNAEQKLIPMWFRACGDKLSNFFKLIKVDNGSLEDLPFIKELINNLLKCIKISQIVEEIELDMTSCLPKLPLSRERVFLWHQLFKHSNKDERLQKFIAPLDVLIPFLIKCFDNCTSDEVEVCTFTELLLFLTNIMETSGIQKCGAVFGMALNLMLHPFVPKDLMKYLVYLYLTFSPEEKDIVHNNILETVKDLQKLMLITQGHEKNILLKCFAIASQVLTEETAVTPAIKSIKDDLIIQYLNSEDVDVKSCATHALTLYCLLDIKEAKLSWSHYEEALNMESGPLKNSLLKGMFDVLQCHGSEVFADIINDGQDKLELFVADVLRSLEDEENEIILKGVLKLYMACKISSPTILANAIVIYFHPDDYTSAQYTLKTFIQQFGKTRDGYDCLEQSFLTLVDLLFDVPKTRLLYKINIEDVVVQLFEFLKMCENPKKSNNEVDFHSSLALRLCEGFLEKPWRLPASDLYRVCHNIMPKKFSTLLNLRELVVQVTESLQSSKFQQKNPYAKNNMRNFSLYLKKIQQALNKAPLIECSINETQNDTSPIIQKRLDYDSSSMQDDSQSRDSNIEVDSSPISDRFESEENESSASVSESSTTRLPAQSVRFSETSDTETPNKVPQSSKPATRNRLSRKTPGPSAKKAVVANSFKTPGPQKNKSGKRQLDINIMKTC